MSSKEPHRGNCHCGAYRFQIELPKPVSAASCDCSLCYKLGALWGFGSQGNLIITKGNETNLATYTTPCVTVKFCKKCGIVVSGEHHSGPLAQKSAVNIRVLIGVNPFKIDIEQQVSISALTASFHSKAFEAPPYKVHKFEEVEPIFDGEDSKYYTGSCHCGLLAARIQSSWLPDIEARECNCSICARVAWVGIYPRKKQVMVIGREHTKEYFCGGRVQGWPFCQVCAVHLFANAYGPSKEVMETWPESRQAEVSEQWDVLPLNLRAFDDIDMNLLRIEQSDEGTEGYVLD